MTLTEDDRDHLAGYLAMTRLIQDRVRTVARRYQTGAYLVGRPGSGKTHAVTAALDEDGRPYRLVNGHVTAAGLFDVFEECPEHVVVFDDIPLLWRDRKAQQIFLAAVGGDPDRPRVVTYVTKGHPRKVLFSGGVVAISNLPLRADPVAQALKSRMSVLEHEPTDDMLTAFMRQEALKGYKGLTPVACREVADFVAAECASSDYRVDLRYYFRGLEDRLFAETERADTPWRTLVRSDMRRLRMEDTDGGVPQSRADRIAWERQVARGLMARDMTRADRAREWMAVTGKDEQSLYRRRKELGL